MYYTFFPDKFISRNWFKLIVQIGIQPVEFGRSDYVANILKVIINICI